MADLTELTNEELRTQINNRKKRGDYVICSIILGSSYDYLKQVCRGVRDNKIMLENMMLVIEYREAMERDIVKKHNQKLQVA